MIVDVSAVEILRGRVKIHLKGWQSAGCVDVVLLVVLCPKFCNVWLNEWLAARGVSGGVTGLDGQGEGEKRRCGFSSKAPRRVFSTQS